MNDNKQATWWMGKGFYQIIEEIMVQVVQHCGNGDVRRTLLWTKMLCRHVMPHFNRIAPEAKDKLRTEIAEIQKYVYNAPGGDKVNSLYEDPDEMSKHLEQMDLVMDYYEKIQELMDYHSMFLPKSEVIDESSPEYFERELQKQL